MRISDESIEIHEEKISFEDLKEIKVLNEKLFFTLKSGETIDHDISGVHSSLIDHLFRAYEAYVKSLHAKV